MHRVCDRGLHGTGRLSHTRYDVLGRGLYRVGCPTSGGPQHIAVRVQPSIDLLLGAFARIPIFLLNQRDQLVFLARDLLEVVIRELVPPCFELPPYLRPLTGKGLRIREGAAPAC